MPLDNQSGLTIADKGAVTVKTPSKAKAKAKAVQQQAKTDASSAASAFVAQAFEAGYSSDEGAIAGNAYASGVALRFSQTVAARLDSLANQVNGGFTVDDSLLESSIAVAALPESDDDWGF